MASLATKDPAGQETAQGPSPLETFTKYRTQLLAWKQGKLDSFSKNASLVEKHSNLQQYEQYLNSKITKKLKPCQTKIFPSEINSSKTDLGFVEPVEGGGDAAFLLETSHLNKNWSMWDGGFVGRKPCWLDPKRLPSAEVLKCKSCKTPMLFLLQIYAPLDAPEFENRGFHRTLYLFCCKNPKCLSGDKGGICALRCQLGKENDCYLSATDGMSEDEVVVMEEQGANDFSMFDSALQFPFFEIVTESELDCLQDSNEDIMKKFNEQVEKVTITADKIKGDEITGEDVKEVMSTLPKAVNDGVGKSMTFFHHRVSVAKDQCLRYSRWEDGEELWTSTENRPDVLRGVPLCPRCNSPRRFEFQVMPQLLFHLDGENSVGLSNDFDFGTIAVYTCTNSCTSNSATNYLEEYVWCQQMAAGKE
eukprot:g8077.t1